MRLFLAVAGILGAMAVALGASAAHGLDAILTAKAVSWVETASRYMLVHAVAILVCALGLKFGASRILKVTAFLFTFGTVIFCGSLLALAFLDLRIAGAAAPIGGTSLMLGWLSLLLVAWKSKSPPSSR